MVTLAIKILAGVLIGIACKFVGDVIEKYLLNARGLQVVRVKYENYIIIASMALFGGLIMWRIPLSAETVYMFLLLIICEVITIADSHYRIIPNELLIGIFVFRIAFGIPGLLGVKGFPTFRVVDSLVGFIVGFIIFMFPAVLSKTVGAGDIKLAAAVGFTLGLMGCMVAVVIMGVLVLIYTFMQRQMPILIIVKTMIPMGPFLAIGMIVVLLLRMNFGTIPI